MRLKKARQIFKAFSDDTRLRIVNLLDAQDLAVKEICHILDRNQSIISKHLTRLRLTGIVGDRRKGINVYYYLIRSKDRSHDRLIRAITDGLSDLEVFKNDLKKLAGLKKKRRSFYGISRVSSTQVSPQQPVAFPYPRNTPVARTVNLSAFCFTW